MCKMLVKKILISAFLTYIGFITDIRTDKIFLCDIESKSLQCSIGESIRIDAISFDNGISTCTDHYSCENASTLVKETCNGKQKCSLKGNDLKYSCPRKPRPIQVHYKCITRWYSFDYEQNLLICGDVSVMNCKKNLIGNFDGEYYTDHLCDYNYPTKYVQGCLNNGLKKMCIGLRACDIRRVDDNDCFFFPFMMSVEYTCIRENPANRTDSSASESSGVTDITQTIESSRIIPKTGNISVSANIDRSQWTIALANDARVLVTNASHGNSFTICAYNWTDFHANLICKYLNISEFGKAGSITTSSEYDRIGIICEENVTDPFDCYPDFSNNSKDLCDSTGDATVKCVASDLQPENSKSVILGIVLAVVAGLFILGVIMLFLRRRKKQKSNTKDEKSRQTNNESSEYENGPTFAIVYQNLNNEESDEMNVQTTLVNNHHANKTKNVHSYFVLDPNETGHNQSKNINVEIDKQSTHMISSDEVQYGTLPEGVYDVSNIKRHVKNEDINVYSHTVDDVYDSSSHKKENDKNDTTYDHFP